METILPWSLKLVAGVLFLAPFLEFLPVAVLNFALYRVRIDTSLDNEVYVFALDPWTMLIFVVSGGITSIALFLGSGPWAAAAGALVALVLTSGCRIQIWVTPVGSRISRRVFGVLPWSVWHSPCAPTLYTDGWGDMMDPEALHVGFGLGDLELAWGDANSGDYAGKLVTEFSDAVGALRSYS